MTTLVLCDDHPLILGGLSALLAEEPTLVILATAEDGIAAEREIRKHMPDIAVLDISMPGLSGIELLRRVNQERWPVRVILLTADISDDQIIDAIAAGASGILLKESAYATLVHCLRTIAQGKKWLPHELVQPAITRRMSADRAISPFALLTRRELEVANLVAEGRSNRDIAAALGMSEGTVKIHLHSIYSKLDVDNRTAAAIMLTRWH